MDVAVRARRVGQVLLGDEHVGPLGHPAAVDVALGRDQLLEGARRMHGPGPPAGLVRPGDPALDREVDLEGPGTVLVAAVGAGDPRGQAVARDVGHGGRGEVEDDRVDVGQLAQRADRDAGLDLSPVLGEGARERVGDRGASLPSRPPNRTRGRRRSARCRPTSSSAGRGGRSRGRRPRRTGPSPAASCSSAGAGSPGRRRRARSAAGGSGGSAGGGPAGRGPRSAPRSWRPRNRTPGATRRRPRRGLPRSRSIDRTITPALPSSSGWARSTSGQRHSSPWRSRSSELQERRADGHRVHRRAVVVQDAGDRQLAGAGAAADRLGGLEHRHLHPLPGERDRAGEPVRARADDDRRAHAGDGRLGAVARRPRPPRRGSRSTRRATAGARPCRRRRPSPPRSGRSRRRRSRSAGGRARRRSVRTRARSPARRRARSRSAPAPPRAAAGRGSGRRRSSSR